MTSSSRRALPWLVSIGAHFAALVAVGLLLAPQSGMILASRVDISLVGAPGPGRGAPPASASAAGRAAVREKSAPSAQPDALSPPDSVRAPSTESLPVPTPTEVLADAASGSAAESGSPTGTLVGWEGVQRKLIRKRNPEFPTVLSATGQEIEGEARIAVAPSGIVTRVEITRSSGYIEIDASIEAALRDYLFTRVEGRIDTVGTVHFRFRLEKQD